MDRPAQPTCISLIFGGLNMRSTHKELLTLVWMSSLFLFGTGLLPAQTGQLTGTITAQDGTPVAGAFVVAAGGAAPGNNQNVRSGSDGSFAFSSLPAGSYQICVQVPNGSLLDPCQWSAAPPSGTVTAGQTVSLGTIQVATGQRLYVKLLDDKGALGANEGRGKTPGAHVLIGVWSGGTFHPMRLRSKGAGTWSHDLVVPFNTPLMLTITSTAFALADANGNSVNAATGASLPIQVAAESTLAPIVFHVTGLNGNGH
jgi:hypothetical protein